MNITFLRGPSVSISASPDDWGLFNADTPDQEQDRDFVSDALNKGLEEIVARAPTKREVSMKEIQSLLGLYRGWGSCDSESYRFVDRVLDTVYGED